MLKIYKYICITFFNALILFTIINLVSWGILEYKLEEKNKDVNKLYHLISYESLTNENLSIKEDSSYGVETLTDYISFLKTNKNEFEYHPATEYQHRPTQTKTYNIIEYTNDFNQRKTFNDTDSNCEKTISIYCFGGSTTLGILTKDHHTWPSFLSKKLNEKIDSCCVLVKNYGTASFTPTQETQQFIELLKLGHRPSLAIFLDGVNVGAPYDASEFSSKIYNKFNQEEITFKSILKVVYKLPIIRLMKGDDYKGIDFFKIDNYDFTELEFNSKYNTKITNRFIENARIRKKLAKLYNVKILQILQPNTYVSYNHEYFSVLGQRYMESEPEIMLQKNYKKIYDSIRIADIGFIDFGNLLSYYAKPGIIDITHYSPDFNKYLADTIFKTIDFGEGIPYHNIDEKSATGDFFQPSYVDN